MSNLLTKHILIHNCANIGEMYTSNHTKSAFNIIVQQDLLFSRRHSALCHTQTNNQLKVPQMSHNWSIFGVSCADWATFCDLLWRYASSSYSRSSPVSRSFSARCTSQPIPAFSCQLQKGFKVVINYKIIIRPYII